MTDPRESNVSKLKTLLDTMPQRGRLDWIGIRPKRREPVESVQRARCDVASGLAGDRYAGTSGKRQITLMQAEHLPVMAAVLGLDVIHPGLLRRNLVVSGINLLALKGQRFRIGDVVLEYTGACHPCSRMEAIFGPGGYNAVRGHGGITARVIASGDIALGDPVSKH